MKKNYTLIGILSIFFFTACKKDFLNTSPTASADSKTTFESVDNTYNVVNGIYRYLYSRYEQQNQPGHGGMMIQNDFMGEDITQAAATWYTSAGSGTGGYVTHRNDQSGYVSYPFRLYYRVVGNANAVLDNIDAAIGDDNKRKIVKGEAFGLRAWAFHNLVQYFAKRYDGANKPNSQPGISLPLHANDIKLPKSTVEEVYAQINKDLDSAIVYLDAGSISPTPNKSHINKNTARALKARVALTMQDYTTAITYANQVISATPGYTLMSIADYQTGFNNILNSEWIWGAAIIVDHADTFGSYFAQISYNGNTTYIRSRPKRINSVLYNLIPATDVRKKMWEPAPNATNFPLPTTAFVREPLMSRKFSISAPNTTLGDVPYLRLSEVYLTLAEAYANTAGNEAMARTTLFNYVSKRDPSYVLSTNSGAALINEILFHRRIELWGEGFRFFDLKRLNQALTRSAVPNYVSASVGGVMDVPAGDPRWQFVIPIAEIQANENIKQDY